MIQYLKKIFRKSYKLCLFLFILKDYLRFKKQQDNRFSVSLYNIDPQIKDKTVGTNFDRHYIYHTAWAARIIQKINPVFHTDISSSLYFVGIASAFIPIKFYDYRPANLELNNLESHAADLLNLPFADNSITSLSCLHTIEHVGLGRYGDPIDSQGDIKALQSLKRVLAPGGSLLIAVPIGKPQIMFNAHRIYSYEQIISYITDTEIQLKEFTFIPEYSGPMIQNADPSLVQKADYACGCFWFVKNKQ